MVGFRVEPAAGQSSQGADDEMERGVQGVLWGGEAAASLRGLRRMLAGCGEGALLCPLAQPEGSVTWVLSRQEMPRGVEPRPSAGLRSWERPTGPHRHQNSAPESTVDPKVWTDEPS